MGGLLFGYDWVVIGGAKPFYEPFFGISRQPVLQGLAMSSALVGCLVGAAVSGSLSDRYGRRKSLIVAAFFFTASAIGTAVVSNFGWFNFYRWLGGVGIGLASTLSPMYIAEVAPAPMRGRLVSLNQLTIVIGILAAQVVNWAIAEPVPSMAQIGASPATQPVAAAGLANSKSSDNASDKAAGGGGELNATRSSPGVQGDEALDSYIKQSWNGQYGWRWMFGAETAPALVFLLLIFCVPESPRWLVKARRSPEATRVLARIGGPSYARQEVEAISRTVSVPEEGRPAWRDLFSAPLRRVLLLGVTLAMFQQWCGINVIFNYAHEVFSAAGYGISDILFAILVTGVVNLLFTLAAFYTVDSVGRRWLMLFGSASLGVIYAVLGIGFYFHSTGLHMLMLVLAAIGCYAMSLAPVTWVVIAEIFPNRIRGVGMSVAVFALWLGCTTLTFSFPLLNAGVGAAGTFWIYAAICGLGFLFIQRALPETRGSTLEEIERRLAPEETK